MTTFYGEILSDSQTLDTSIRIDRSIKVKHVRAHLFRQGLLSDGQVEMSIYEGLNLVKTVDIDYADINSVDSNTYAHGWFRFDFEVPLNHNYENTYTEYTIKLKIKNMTNKLIWLVSDLNVPLAELHNDNSIYARGLEVYTTLEF